MLIVSTYLCVPLTQWSEWVEKWIVPSRRRAVGYPRLKMNLTLLGGWDSWWWRGRACGDFFAFCTCGVHCQVFWALKIIMGVFRSGPPWWQCSFHCRHYKKPVFIVEGICRNIHPNDCVDQNLFGHENICWLMSCSRELAYMIISEIIFKYKRNSKPTCSHTKA
jgi:hypothetical protein